MGTCSLYLYGSPRAVKVKGCNIGRRWWPGAFAVLLPWASKWGCSGGSHGHSLTFRSDSKPSGTVATIRHNGSLRYLIGGSLDNLHNNGPSSHATALAWFRLGHASKGLPPIPTRIASRPNSSCAQRIRQYPV